MNLGYADTQTILRAPASHPATAAALAVPSAARHGTLVAYHGSSAKDHGYWILDGPCPCRCGGLGLWRRERDGLHRLVHVSESSVTGRRA